MKGGVTRGLLTKDVRSADGWQIGIDVFEYVQVKMKSVLFAPPHIINVYLGT